MRIRRRQRATGQRRPAAHRLCAVSRPNASVQRVVMCAAFLFIAAATILPRPQFASGVQDAGGPPGGAADGAAVESLVHQLADDDYRVREEATRKLIALGPEVARVLRQQFAAATDPEVQLRLRYVLDNIVPPQQAVLVARAAAESGVRPGDLITHVNGRRVRTAAELGQRLRPESTPVGAMLRVTGVGGPREVGPLDAADLPSLLDYVAPRGERVARALRLYADGFAEQAAEVLNAMSEPAPVSELNPLLHARMAYTAGDADAALRLLSGHESSVLPQGDEWTSPSELETSGPGPAPYHLEWSLFSHSTPPLYQARGDPDLRVQRICVPARRYVDALLRAAELWAGTYRGALGGEDDTNRIAGNQLAVIGWMLSEIGLRSECCRIIEPRSQILRRAPFGLRKWVRVETDAWLPFLAGQEKAAIDGFYDDAISVLQRPPEGREQNARIRNPEVAARLAFFLYQVPDDPRVEEALRIVSQPSHPVLLEYIDWMLLALHERNQEIIRRHLQLLLPRVADRDAFVCARAVALLEYVQPRPDVEVIAAARQRVFEAAEGAQRTLWVAAIDALRQLVEGRPQEALEALAPVSEQTDVRALRYTAEFLANPPPAAGNHALLRDPRLAVPIGTEGRWWLILSRDARPLLFDAQQSRLTAADKPSPTWFPSPLTWPWIGREAAGRVWLYSRRRVSEVAPDAPQRLVVNIRTEDIPAFDRHLADFFTPLAEAVASVPQPGGENGEFLRSEVRAHGEFVDDPDLPDLGVVHVLEQDPRVVHAALRGGPHVLIDVTQQRAWTSLWMQERLGLPRPPVFFAQALWPASTDDGPVVMLTSDQGLIRFAMREERVERLALPGEEPYPPLIPESTPYLRRDPRFLYCARLPEDGGRVYRLRLAEGRVEELAMVNEVLPQEFYRVRLRADIRRELDDRLVQAGLLNLQAFIADAEQVVADWAGAR